MHITKDQALQIFATIPAAIEQIKKIDGDVWFDLCGEQTYKTHKQNKLFHSLLQCFFESGCASFDSYDDLRLYYKRVAGLVKRQGNFLVESSWSEATKSQAKTAIDLCIRDMDCSGVIGTPQGKKYEAILKGINQWYAM